MHVRNTLCEVGSQQQFLMMGFLYMLCVYVHEQCLLLIMSILYIYLAFMHVVLYTFRIFKCHVMIDVTYMYLHV